MCEVCGKWKEAGEYQDGSVWTCRACQDNAGGARGVLHDAGQGHIDTSKLLSIYLCIWSVSIISIGCESNMNSKISLAYPFL